MQSALTFARGYSAETIMIVARLNGTFEGSIH